MKEVVGELYIHGLTYAQIARKLNISVGKVAGIVHRLGIARKDKSHCNNASKANRGERVVVFESHYKLGEPKLIEPIFSPFYSPKQRAAYEDLRKAVENTK